VASSINASQNDTRRIRKNLIQMTSLGFRRAGEFFPLPLGSPPPELREQQPGDQQRLDHDQRNRAHKCAIYTIPKMWVCW